MLRGDYREVEPLRKLVVILWSVYVIVLPYVVLEHFHAPWYVSFVVGVVAGIFVTLTYAMLEPK
jgi:hypothetical protein